MFVVRRRVKKKKNTGQEYKHVLKFDLKKMKEYYNFYLNYECLLLVCLKNLEIVEKITDYVRVINWVHHL